MLSIKILAALLGCSGSATDAPSDDGPIGTDDSATSTEFATATITSTIGDAAETCGAVVKTENGEIIDEGSTDPESDDYGLTLFANEPVEFFVGNAAITDREGDPRHVKRTENGEELFYTGNPVPDTLQTDETAHYTIALHRQFDSANVVCVRNSWSWNENAPDHKGVQGETNIERDPIDLFVKGEATYTDPDSGEVKTGVLIRTNETAGNLAGSGSGGTWVMGIDHIYFTPEEGEHMRVTSSELGATTFSFKTEGEGIAVEEIVCTVY